MSGIYRGLAALTTKRVGGIQLNTIDNFRVSQNELLQSISDLKVMIQPEFLKVKPNAKTVYETLCSLGDMMKSHLSDEGKNLFPPLLIHEDNKLKSLAWGFITGERPLRKQFDSYYKKWGVSWIYRWMKDQKERVKLMRQEPDIMDYYNAYQELLKEEKTAGY